MNENKWNKFMSLVVPQRRHATTLRAAVSSSVVSKPTVRPTLPCMRCDAARTQQRLVGSSGPIARGQSLTTLTLATQPAYTTRPTTKHTLTV